MMSQTSSIAKGIDPNGELYQERGFRALSILVRQAVAGRPIFYSEIALELKMDNPRNMNFVLAAVGTSLGQLGSTWGEPIPPLGGLVVNKSSEMPGDGFAEFAPDPATFRSAPLRVRRQIVDGILAKVYSYRKWPKVLQYFGAAPLEAPDLADLLPESARIALGGRGESDAHKAFKEFVARNPALLGIDDPDLAAQLEYCFASSDTVDVLFSGKRQYVAVEVKSRISSEFDILRGIFQCVKYQALLDATVAVEQKSVDTRTMLVLEASLPDHLRSIVHTLQVEVCENFARDRAT